MKTGRPGAVPDGMASTETNSEPLLKPKERALGLLVLELDGALAAREVAHAARTKVLPQPARDRLRVSELRHPARREGARGLDGAQQLEQVVSACAIGRDDDVETGRKRMAPVIDVHKAAEAHGSDQGRSSLQY